MEIINIYTRIENLMDEQGIDKKKLAEITGINYNTLRGYFNPKASITLENIIKIAKALNVLTSYLLGETELKRLDGNQKFYEDFSNFIYSCIKKESHF